MTAAERLSRDTRANTRTTRYTATIEPQAWQNDYAVPVDPPGPVSWDCTEAVYDSPEYYATVQATVGQDRMDYLRDDPAAPPWVGEWTGPFSICVTTEGQQ